MQFVPGRQAGTLQGTFPIRGHMLLAITLVGLGFSIRKSKWSLQTPGYCQRSRAKGQGGAAQPRSSLLTAGPSYAGLPLAPASSGSHRVLPLCDLVADPPSMSEHSLLFSGAEVSAEFQPLQPRCSLLLFYSSDLLVKQILTHTVWSY